MNLYNFLLKGAVFYCRFSIVIFLQLKVDLIETIILFYFCFQLPSCGIFLATFDALVLLGEGVFWTDLVQPQSSSIVVVVCF